MSVRQKYAAQFYSGDIDQYINEFITGEEVYEFNRPVAGVVPHAGWFFSGKTAAKVFDVFSMKYSDAKTVILLGTVHNVGIVNKHAIYGSGAWETPLGDISIDEELAAMLDKDLGKLSEINNGSHDWEHSIEVQLPFVKHMFPDIRIVPIAVIPTHDSKDVGIKIAETIKKNDYPAFVIGTTDLTHYGPNYGFSPAGKGDEALKWMHNNDRSILDLALTMEADKIINEAKENRNACGSGALAATVGYAIEMGAKKGILLDYITSHEVYTEGDFKMGVGYAGIVFPEDHSIVI
ncbi:MAG: AmmeMemoRadiSam system protein B [bacterium]|nr:AmmeMemoRadiSam system protein B [bacterium]